MLLTFKALTTHQPNYLYNQLHVCTLVRQLQSTCSTNCLQLNRSRTMCADQDFRNATPLIWNSLPHQLTNYLSSPASFHHNLKTHFLLKSFCHWLLWPVCNCDSSHYSDIWRPQLRNNNKLTIISCLELVHIGIWSLPSYIKIKMPKTTNFCLCPRFIL
jgi:hypothetical protein